MNKKTIALVTSASVLSAILTFGVVKISGMSADGLAQSNGPKAMYWVAPMDPNFRRDEPGKSPMGMDLIPVYAEDGDSSENEGVLINPSVVNNIGVREGVAKRQDLTQSIHAVGYLNYDDNKVSHVHIRTKGWIENLVVKTVGERVKKGQLLFEYYAPDLVDAQAEFVQATRSGRAMLIRASKERLHSLGFSAQQVQVLRSTSKVQDRIKVFATQDGVITHMDVREGMFISPNTTIITLADLSTVWMLVDVFERQAMSVEAGQTAEVSFAYAPGKTWLGTVDYVYPIVDPVTRAFKARLKFENPTEILKPNMYGRVQIEGKTKVNTLVVPSEALIRSGRTNRIVVSLGEGRFQAVEVISGMETKSSVEILQGLKEGTRIVTSGQFLIDSEANLMGSIKRLNSEVIAVESKTAGAGLPTAKAIINTLMPEHNMVNLSHEPIPALGWPEMTMDFKLLDGVSLDGLKPGQSVEIQLQKDAEGMFIIGEIHSVNGGR